MRLSRVFARLLRTSTRTLETWEQGRSKPNAQAAALILLVREFPDTLNKLQVLGIRSARGKLKWTGDLDAMRRDK
jgi:putative transcriptional regulator